MTLPAFFLGSVIAGLFGAATHLITGGGLGRLLAYLIFGGIAFWLGHFVAEVLGWTFLSIGAIHFGMALLFILPALTATALLSAPAGQLLE